MNKYLNKQGLQHLVEQLAAQGVGGGGTSAAGRVKRTGTAESPIDLNAFLQPESYTLSGVIDNLPDEMADIVSEYGITDMKVNFDVDMSVSVGDEEPSLTFFLVSQALKFLSFVDSAPVSYERAGISQRSETPYTSQQIEVLEQDGYVLIDEYTAISYDGWSKLNTRALTDYKIKRLYFSEDQGGSAVRLSDLFIENVPDGLDYFIAFQDENLTGTDFVEDIIISSSWLDENLFPQLRLSFLDETMRYNNMGKAHRSFSKIGDMYMLASVTFDSEAAKNMFFNTFQYWNVYLVYRSSYLVI
ncbi:MAG: hypothetical protein LBS36_05200 [Oscillospiraceae bacterium]|jgi:hypothetical protein|nr:hypothetical protein [Oscillospiraceae bacterium]